MAKGGKFRQHVDVKPCTDKQARLLEAIKVSNVVFALGPAGTGKTYLSTMLAAKALMKGDIERIVCVRPNVDAGEPLGFDPGSEEEKLSRWLAPILGILQQALGKGDMQGKMAAGVIELVSLQKMRGRHFDDSWILFDEAQNSTCREMKMLLTRKADTSKVIVNGDLSQTDLHVTSGLYAALEVNTRGNLNYPVVQFEHDDIVRGGDCKAWVIGWEKYEQGNRHTDNAAQIPMVL